MKICFQHELFMIVRSSQLFVICKLLKMCQLTDLYLVEHC
jgi:hypothetical protein